jgi:Spy/CpxP family protein refolding chaperone
MATPSRAGPGIEGGAQIGRPRILAAHTARSVGMSPRQATRFRLAVRENHLQLQAVRQRIAECRRHLRRVLATPEPDSSAVLELLREEQILVERERRMGAGLEPVVAAILTPEQVDRLRRLRWG